MVSNTDFGFTVVAVGSIAGCVMSLLGNFPRMLVQLLQSISVSLRYYQSYINKTLTESLLSGTLPLHVSLHITCIYKCVKKSLETFQILGKSFKMKTCSIYFENVIGFVQMFLSMMKQVNECLREENMICII